MSRRRYRWNEATAQLEEVALDAPVTPRVTLGLEGSLYEGARSPVDGSDISSRTKYREHLKRTGLAPAEDFRQTWADAPAKREAEEQKQRREDVGRTIYQLQQRSQHGQRKRN